MKAIEMTGIDYYCQISDVKLIKQIVRELPYMPVCINIGAAMGTSALAMLEARPDSHIYSIDIEKCPLEAEALEKSGINYKSRYTFLCGKSQGIAAWFTDTFANFVFIDGGHSYEDCYQDAVVWYKVLKPNGVMAFHDYGSSIKVLECVKHAVDDVSRLLGLQQFAHEGTLIAFRKVMNEDISDSSR